MILNTFSEVKHVEVATDTQRFVFSIRNYNTVTPGTIAFSLPQVSNQSFSYVESNYSIMFLM